MKVPELWNVNDLGKAIVTQWYVGVGDIIKEDMPVCQIMAAKVTIEVNTNVRGKVKKLLQDINAEIVPGDDLIEIESS
ncbi:biotin/lipoyl-containing protein [Ferroplasma sp. Type II]|uniref:biotin/lipoyl-containing protein n=1 Tax=Ferroplasma sp. Type II TaxID=261388 RepID=UPI0025B9D390|nr:biotin/lipoyl-containing protein [Ferroplasma sp. Type II]